jgi:mevalonate kinase
VAALDGLVAFVRDNFETIYKSVAAMITSWLAYKVTIGKTRVEAGKTAVASKKIDLDEDRILLERANAVDQRMDKLVAHLERQLEKQAQEARKERQEMKAEMAMQTREIRSLKDHVGVLTDMILSLGGKPPPYKGPTEKPARE